MGASSHFCTVPAKLVLERTAQVARAAPCCRAHPQSPWGSALFAGVEGFSHVLEVKQFLSVESDAARDIVSLEIQCS